MKSKLFFLTLFSLFLLCSCEADRITLKIVSPKDGDKISMYEKIEVVVTAEAQKGFISRVTLEVEGLEDVLAMSKKPYTFTLSPGTFSEKGVYFLSVKAYSSKGVFSGDAIDIIITE
jgi:hypothetical protein